MGNITETRLLGIIRAAADSSAQRWEMAIETDDSDRGFAADADECESAYEAAIEALEDCYEDYLGVVRTHLEEAERLERNAGDSQDARRALAALDDLVSDDEDAE